MHPDELEEQNTGYSTDDECPDCEDGVLVERYERTFDGKPFLGCSNYPKCEFTQTLSGEEVN